MDSLRKLREQHKNISAKVFSNRAGSPTAFAQQRRGYGAHSEIKGLPTQACPAIQDLDPDSGTFGQFFLSMGFGGLGNQPLGGM